MEAALLNRRRGHQHESAGLVAVLGVGGVHGVENIGRFDPNRRIFVARDVEDQETVGFGVIGGKRRDMAADLLADRLAQIVDDDEMAGWPRYELASLRNSSTELIRGMMDFGLDRLCRENPADLVERHAPPRQDVARQNSVRLVVEDIVLGERTVGRVFGDWGRWNAKRVEHHHDARDPAIGLGLLGQKVAGEREIGLPRVALSEVGLAVMGGETGEIVGQGERVGIRADDEEPQRQRRARDKQLRHVSHPSTRLGRERIGPTAIDRQPRDVLGVNGLVPMPRAD